MIKFVDLSETKPLSLSDYADRPEFAPLVSELRAEATLIAPRMSGRTVWMINSTDKGGGVAEMLPHLIPLMEELGISVRWAVIQTDKLPFFKLTKRLHNLLHGDGRGGTDLGADDAKLYEEVNRNNVESLSRHLGAYDVLVVHDPQPLPLGHMLAENSHRRFLWRCHIGLPEHTEATRAAWNFMAPYFKHTNHSMFSAPEYIPSMLSGRASILHPAIDPLSHKNRDLSINKTIGILCNAGLQRAHHAVPTRDFEHRVRRLSSTGAYETPDEFGLLFRPIVLQVSRWDRLKGWVPLLDGFLKLKKQVREGKADAERDRNKKRLAHARLVLAGPDPATIQDDPEGVAVFEELKARYQKLDKQDQEDVAILVLPMESRKENALIVNALQRCASVVTQNSLQEGFGLTVTEAMWKGLAVVGSGACGIRQQIRDQIDGRLIQHSENSDEIADKLYEMIVDTSGRFMLGRRARRRVYESFLVFTQLRRYMRLFAEDPAMPMFRY